MALTTLSFTALSYPSLLLLLPSDSSRPQCCFYSQEDLDHFDGNLALNLPMVQQQQQQQQKPEQQ